MDYEWDPVKARLNARKHRVLFADAVTAFSDPYGVSIPDKHADEERFALLGVDANSTLLVVVYTWRNSTIRIISARKATRRERMTYEAHP